MSLRYALPCFPVVLAIGAIPFRGLAQGDTCTTALQVVSGIYSSTGPTSGDAGPACGAGNDGNWYLYTASFNGAITITSCHPLNNGTQFDTYLKVYTGTCDDLVCVAYNDDIGQSGQSCSNNVFASHLQVNVTAGQNYYIVWTNTFSSLPFTWELNECEGTAVGATYYDNNDNGTREAGEPHAPVMLLVQPGDHYVYSGNDPYSFCTDIGEHTISVPTPPLYHIAVPSSRSFDIITLGQQVTGADFGFQGIPGIYDGSSSIWGWNPWIGNNTQLHLHYANIGTEDITATLTLEVDPQLTFVSASITPSSSSGQNVTWNLGVLTPGTSGSINVTISTPATVAPNSSVENGVLLAIAETDIDLLNNSDRLQGNATTSFDPNDKQVSEIIISPDDVAEQKPLEYTIRFQNTGTAPAVNIVIKDSLDGDWDLSTFEMVGASHPLTVTVNNEVAIWTFANIMLPTEDSDALGSQGSLHYRMAPKISLVLGDQLTNRADIYFDYNVPVLTNTTITTVALTAGIEEASLGNGLSVVPSPSNGTVSISWNDAQLNNARFSVMDPLGRTVYTSTMNGSVANGRSMDLSFLPEGSYVARLTSDARDVWTRFVIQH
ncbi:MAG: T9SS type A sorting domain-containing protein [Flavobacteriales bacterium]|nr:T9SS type A sorting domain-containing protein [Flavobacteriales bacterium]